MVFYLNYVLLFLVVMDFTLYFVLRDFVPVPSARNIFVAPYSRATRGRGRGVRSPLPFFENRKNCPDFREKGLDCARLRVKFSIQNEVLRACRRKNVSKILFKFFCCRAFFLVLFDEMLIEVPYFHETSPPLKDIWLRTCLSWVYLWPSSLEVARNFNASEPVIF